MARRKRLEQRWLRDAIRQELRFYQPPPKPRREQKRESHRKRKAAKLSLHMLQPFCLYCAKILSISQATLDHMQPLSRGGSNEPTNLTISCYDCNHRKGNMTVLEFVIYLKERDNAQGNESG